MLKDCLILTGPCNCHFFLDVLTLYRMVMPIGTPFLKKKLIINQ